jgi:hypothetical protein
LQLSGLEGHGKLEWLQHRNPFTQQVVQQATNVRLHTQTPLLLTADIRLQKFKVNNIINSTIDHQIFGNRKTELQIHPKIQLRKILDSMYAKVNPCGTPDFIAEKQEKEVRTGVSLLAR